VFDVKIKNKLKTQRNWKRWWNSYCN